MTVLVRLGAVESRRFGFELVKPSSVVVSGGSASATVSALGSVEFTSCENIKLVGVFSGGYDNYMVVARHQGSQSGAPGLVCRLLSGTTEASGSNYTQQALVAGSTTVSGARDTSQTSGRWSASDSNLRSGVTGYVYGPFLAQPTASRSVSIDAFDNARVADYAWTHSLSTSYDGLMLIVGSGNFSGRVAVYGMRG
jgi:hypothetical protein